MQLVVIHSCLKNILGLSTQSLFIFKSIKNKTENFTITLLKKWFQTLLNSKSSAKTQPWNVKLHYKVFYVNWNKKTFFNKTEYDQSGSSAPACIYGTPKMHKFSSSDSFLKLCTIVSSIGTFNCNLACFLCDLLSPLVPN